MDDELELGIPAAQPKKARKKPDENPPPQPNRSWARYTASNRRYCDVCFKRIERINGVPKSVINKAWWTEDGPDGRLWLCHPDKADREVRLGKF